MFKVYNIDYERIWRGTIVSFIYLPKFFISFSSSIVKSTLMQIRKFPYMFVFIRKQ